MTRIGTTTRLSRSAHGFDSGPTTDVTPCNLMPEAWELDRRMYPARRYATAYRAVQACRTCPALQWCRGQDPPGHDCVQAATVWWRGRPYTLPEFYWFTQEGK